MKRTFTTIACLGALFLSACTSDSSLPDPSGKGRIRAINAMPGSPEVVFKIEERTLGILPYKQWSTPTRFDDFEYNFNFDVKVPDEIGQDRVATLVTKIDADRDYVFVVTGTDVYDPTITIWETDVRAWTEGETVFEASFSHLSDTLGDVDVYFADPATPPLTGEQVATLSYGDVMDPMDFEQGAYVITITEAGNVNNVYFTSGENSFNATTSHTMALLDGNANDTTPYLVMTISDIGLSLRITDPSYVPTIRFVHAAKTLQAVDVYDDETLTSQVATGVTFGVATPDLPTATEDKVYYFTPAGSTATTLFSQPASSPPDSQHSSMYLIGDTDAWSGVYVTLDRSSASTFARLRIFHGAFENSVVNFYVLPRGEPRTEDSIPRMPRVGFGLLTASQELAAGSYDLYVTDISEELNQLAGPYELDVANGDVVFLQIVDTDDPTMIEFQDVSIP